MEVRTEQEDSSPRPAGAPGPGQGWGPGDWEKEEAGKDFLRRVKGWVRPASSQTDWGCPELEARGAQLAGGATRTSEPWGT